MNILELKMSNESLVIEDKDFGNPLFFISEATKGMSDDDFYKWIARCIYYELDDEQRKQFHDFKGKFPNLIDMNFLYNLVFLSHSIFEMNKEKIKKLVDIKKMSDESQLYKQNHKLSDV